jgi:hypothetical protein
MLPGSDKPMNLGNAFEAETTKLEIGAVNYDRIIYISTSDLTNSYYMFWSLGCWFQTKIYINDQVIYSSFQDSQFGGKTFQQNYNFILPSGATAYIKQQKENLHWYTGSEYISGPIIIVKSLKFGL